MSEPNHCLNSKTTIRTTSKLVVLIVVLFSRFGLPSGWAMPQTGQGVFILYTAHSTPFRNSSMISLYITGSVSIDLAWPAPGISRNSLTPAVRSYILAEFSGGMRSSFSPWMNSMGILLLSSESIGRMLFNGRP